MIALTKTKPDRKESEKFVNQLKDIKSYWLSLDDKSTEEVVNGVLFSLLVMIDGDSSINNFHPLKVINTMNGNRIDCGYLHEIYCAE